MRATINITEISGVGEEHRARVLLLSNQIQKITAPRDSHQEKLGIGAIIHLKDGATRIYTAEEPEELAALLEAEATTAGPLFARAVEALDGIERSLHRLTEEVEAHITRARMRT